MELKHLQTTPLRKMKRHLTDNTLKKKTRMTTRINSTNIKICINVIVKKNFTTIHLK
jgi:hypothetical protein